MSIVSSLPHARYRPIELLTVGITRLLSWHLVALLSLFLLASGLVAQLPLNYRFLVGYERGIGSDLPFLRGFYPYEALDGSDPNLAQDRFRWSKGPEAVIDLPGVGRRGVVLELSIASHQAQQNPDLPATILQLSTASGVAMELPLRRESARYQLYLPPSAANNGRLTVYPHVPTWQIAGDRRDELGFALAHSVAVRSVPEGLVLPDLTFVTGWLLALPLLWLMLSGCGFAQRQSFWLLLPLVASLPFLHLLSAPRLGFTGEWIAPVALLALGCAIGFRWATPPLLARLRIVTPPTILPWLVLLLVVSVALKYGGRWFPDSMPGDIQLHVNRGTGSLVGEVYLAAQHRGLPFPFPPGLYVSLLPLTLFGIPLRDLFPVFAGIFEALSVALIYGLVVRAGGTPRVALLAAAIYGLSAVSFMTTWFSFQTQTSAQVALVAALAVLVARWPTYNDLPTFGVLVFLLIQVFLGHIGSFINLLLLALLALPLLWWQKRHDPVERAGVGWLALVGVAATAFVALFYYTAFWGLIWEQIVGVSSGGLNEVTGKQPIPPATTLQVLWQGGLIDHYGFFPVLLAVVGALLASTTRMQSGIVITLIWATLAVTLFQALLPLYTLSSISTRFLSFAAWAIAVGSGLAFWRFGQRGRAGRVIVWAMALYALWISVVVFIDALTMRKPPIEPF